MVAWWELQNGAAPGKLVRHCAAWVEHRLLHYATANATVLPLFLFCSAEASSTQGMGIDDLFSREGGTLLPVLTALQVPVRAVVMPLTDERASRWVGSWAGPQACRQAA